MTDEPSPLIGGVGRAPLVDEDLRRVVMLALDLAFYRSVADDAGLGTAAWLELHHAVRHLPERP